MFTLTYFVRSVCLIVYAIILTGNEFQNKYMFNNAFAQYYLSICLYMVWDLPVILTTVKLNYNLLQELRQDIANHSYFRRVPDSLTSSDY
jgi:hypothetical protein